ncbi:YraN family protein [Brachybacterium sp. EF45031]|uniref:YraN family protein n=1 Tax=Brachybacterium sillae TaxID=2810536 RepID=UPI00217D0AF6|nr:YraN family protein [Brachybacterium sillae]MCS6712326.1 YraN family protein [Brachybacterium sillae]
MHTTTPPRPLLDRLDHIASLSARELGELGEDWAAARLEQQGWTLLERNVRLDRGEIDLIALDGTSLVFVEVKTRRTLVTGAPQASVTATKVRRLRALIGRYLTTRSVPHTDVRLDVIAVLAPPGRPLEMEHLKGVW